MTEKQDFYYALVGMGGVVVLGLMSEYRRQRRLMKRNDSLDVRSLNEAILYNRRTAKWITEVGAKLDPVEFTKQFQEKLDFAIFIAHH